MTPDPMRPFRITRSSGARSGQVSVIIVLILFFFSVILAALRFWRLGDLSPHRKFIEAFLWFLGSFGAGLALVKGLLAVLLPGGGSSMSASSYDVMRDVRNLKPEELTSLESELPELDRPEVSGMMGKPPEELAEALRKLSESDNQ